MWPSRQLIRCPAQSRIKQFRSRNSPIWLISRIIGGMPIQVPIPVPKKVNIAGGGAHPPNLVQPNWLAQGVVTTQIGSGVQNVTVRFIDLDTNITVEALSTKTGPGGKFSCLVPPNKAGYRAKPLPEYYIFCPAYFDFKGNSPIISFNATRKDQQGVEPK